MTGGVDDPATEKLGGLPMLQFADGRAFEFCLAGQPADAPGAWLKLAKNGNIALDARLR